MLLLALAIAPGLAITLFIIYRDKFEKEPRKTLLISFAWGVISTIPAAIVELVADKQFEAVDVGGIIMFTFLFVAVVEELVKYIPLRYYAFTRKSFTEPLDGIVHGVMIAMGFATLENIGYVVLQEQTTAEAFRTAWQRMLLAVPGHATWGVIMGYFVGLAKFDYRRRPLLLFTGLLLAVAGHGTYDSWLFVGQRVDESTATFLVIGAIVTNVFALIISLTFIRAHRRTSKNLFKNAPVLTIRNASVKDIPLIRSLSFQIWPETYKSILSPLQIKYMMQIIYAEDALRRQMNAGHQFIIVYNAGVPVGFASFSEVESTIFKLHKIYIHPGQQGRGVGGFVLEQVINDIKPRGATALQLNVNRNNKAKDFYTKFGFTIIRSEDIDIGGGYFMNDYVMEKSLIASENELVVSTS